MSGAAGALPMMPMMPHMLCLSSPAFRLGPALQLAEPGGPARLVGLRRPADGQRIGGNVAGDDAARRRDRAVADRHGCDQRIVGADEDIGADHRAILEEPVVIAGYGAGADIAPGPDLGIAQISQMIGLGPGAEPGILQLDEIADMGVGSYFRFRTDPGERADDRAGADDRPFDVAEGLDLDPILDRDSGSEHDIRADHDIAPEPG